MKLKGTRVIELAQALRVILATPISGPTAYRLKRLSRKVYPDADLLQDTRNELIKKHGQADAEGNISVPPGTAAWSAFMGDYIPILNEEIELDGFDRPVPVSWEDDVKKIPLIAGDVFGPLEDYGAITVSGDPLDKPAEKKEA